MTRGRPSSFFIYRGPQIYSACFFGGTRPHSTGDFRGRKHRPQGNCAQVDEPKAHDVQIIFILKSNSIQKHDRVSHDMMMLVARKQARTTRTRALTSPRSIGFCAIWDCINLSSSSIMVSWNYGGVLQPVLFHRNNNKSKTRCRSESINYQRPLPASALATEWAVSVHH